MSRTRATADVIDLTGIEPVGVIHLFCGSSAPTGYLLCNGDTIPNGIGTVQGRTADFSALYGLLGSSYGAAGKLPDFRGRTPIGTGQGTGLTNRALGATGGAETHTLLVSEIPSHRHEVKSDIRGASGDVNPDGSLNQGNTSLGFTEFEGGGQAHNNMQPFLAVNYIIKF